MDQKKIFNRLYEAIINGDEEEAKIAAEDAIKAEISPKKAIQEGLSKAMAVVGKKFNEYEMFLPDVMLAADSMKAAMTVLTSNLSETQKEESRIGGVVIGTALGDIHDIGKNLVAAYLEVAGFEVHDLGIDTSPKVFIKTAIEKKADIIAVSSLITASMFYMKDVVKDLQSMGKRGKYYVILGGGSTTPDYAKKIGADGWGKYADDGIDICKNLMKNKPSRPLPEPLIGGK